ncbi:unnamed protein product [Dracunculus medinensis]|uniref:SWIM-type domain-containing protein n=1 Tax=Dracunculus medinensis TaxID=318479 RepID=A0A0N4UE27_DRAME|nr:unnamed protein product [Dracunculus medinensis]
MIRYNDAKNIALPNFYQKSYQILQLQRCVRPLVETTVTEYELTATNDCEWLFGKAYNNCSCKGAHAHCYCKIAHWVIVSVGELLPTVVKKQTALFCVVSVNL